MDSNAHQSGSPQASGHPTHEPAAGAVLFVLAHNDDEFFVLPRVLRERAEGRECLFLFTTDGAAYGESPERRLSETLAVLGRCAVDPTAVVSLGTQLGIRDGTSHQSISSLWRGMQESLKGHAISKVFTLAWDGGHNDHDAAHLLAVAFARLRGVPVMEFAAYNSYRMPKPLFRCMSLIPGSGELSKDKVSCAEAVRWALTPRHYRSQRRAFLGLLGFCLPQILLRRCLVTREVNAKRYLERPHEGPLFYEVRFKVPHSEFLAATRGFIEEHSLGTAQ